MNGEEGVLQRGSMNWERNWKQGRETECWPTALWAGNVIIILS